MEQFYLIHVYGSVDPSVVAGPFDSYARLLAEARTFNDNQMSDEDGLFYLTITDGKPAMGSFTSGELEDEDDDGND